MNQAQMLHRVDEILKVLPKDVTALQLAIRYAGMPELQAKIFSAVEMLQQLKTDLGGSNV